MIAGILYVTAKKTEGLNALLFSRITTLDPDESVLVVHGLAEAVDQACGGI